MVASDPVAEKRRVQAAQKDLRGEASQFLLFVFVARVRKTSTITSHEHDSPARRLSATKHMSLFQQRAST